MGDVIDFTERLKGMDGSKPFRDSSKEKNKSGFF